MRADDSPPFDAVGLRRSANLYPAQKPTKSGTAASNRNMYFRMLGSLLRHRLFFTREDAPRCLDDVIFCNSVFSHQFISLSRLSERVADGDEFLRSGDILCEEFRDGAAEPALHLMVFGGDDRPGLAGRFQDNVVVKRLDGVHVDQTDADSLGCEHLFSQDRLPDLEAAGDDREVVALY